MRTAASFSCSLVAVAAIVGISIGVGWWIHPGAGLAFGCAASLIDLWPTRSEAKS